MAQLIPSKKPKARAALPEPQLQYLHNCTIVYTYTEGSYERMELCISTYTKASAELGATCAHLRGVKIDDGTMASTA